MILDLDDVYSTDQICIYLHALEHLGGSTGFLAGNHQFCMQCWLRRNLAVASVSVLDQLSKAFKSAHEIALPTCISSPCPPFSSIRLHE